ncbi:hypothetical protein SEA_GARDENB_41 [Microbacterium phage GardenB]|nr:hypothetical protein SEA_GARDENB_41 [Microbacterium phage GardenB]
MSRLLCWLGFHRWGYEFVGSSWQPDDYVYACRVCGVENPDGMP